MTPRPPRRESRHFLHALPTIGKVAARTDNKRALLVDAATIMDITFRRIDLDRDSEIAIANHRDACIASFGSAARVRGAAHYLQWLAARIEEYPDGNVMAFAEDECVGQLELQVPFGLKEGYVNLFYVAPAFRGKGLAATLHDYCERYFRSWEATQVDLHVSNTNERAIGFYRKMGYRLARVEARETRLWLMSKSLLAPATYSPK